MGAFCIPKGFFAHGVFVKFKKFSHLIYLAQFKLGELIFPMFEPVLRLLENKDPEVRQHFNQALVKHEREKTSYSFVELKYGIEFEP